MLFVKEILIFCLIYYWIIAVLAEAAEIRRLPVKKCRSGREFETKSDIDEVIIGPCPPTGSTCELYKGANATLTVKFTPTQNFTGQGACNLKSKLLWISKIEMDFGGLSANACDYMRCPLVADQEVVFNATFLVSKMWHTGPYHLKFKIQESDEEGERKKKHRQGGKLILCQLLKVRLAGQPAEYVIN